MCGIRLSKVSQVYAEGSWSVSEVHIFCSSVDEKLLKECGHLEEPYQGVPRDYEGVKHFQKMCTTPKSFGSFVKFSEVLKVFREFREFFGSFESFESFWKMF